MEISKSLAEPREDSSIALCLSWDTGLALCLSWEELLPISPTRLGWVNSPPSHLRVPKIPADVHRRYLCHLSLTIVVMWSPQVPVSSLVRVAGGPCHAGLLLRGQQTKQLTSASSETLRSFIADREVASGRGVTPSSATVPGRGHLVL